MSETKKKIESGAEKTGESIGKGAKKTAKAVNDFGKGLKKGIKKKNKKGFPILLKENSEISKFFLFELLIIFHLMC
jgi:hypothetical protein